MSIISDIFCSILIRKRVLAEHDNRLGKVLLKVGESALKFNSNKYQFRKENTVFWGHIISSEIIRVDPSKIDAITKMLVQ